MPRSWLILASKLFTGLSQAGEDLPAGTEHVFIRLCTFLKREIALSQPRVGLTGSAPSALPGYLSVFLCSSLSISLKSSQILWRVYKDLIWSSGEAVLTRDEQDLVLRHGYHPSFMANECLAPMMFYPPLTSCTECGRGLTDHKRQAVVSFSMAGTSPAFRSYFRCRYCRIQYHPEYRVNMDTKTREYYGGVPQHIQVDHHFYFSTALCRYLTAQMGTMAGAASNCASLYNNSMAELDALPTSLTWQFSLMMTGSQVWNAFALHAILLDLSERPEPVRLSLDDSGTQPDRLRKAMEERNQYIRDNQQPAWDHACATCCVMTEGEGEGHRGLRYLRALVVDGVTLGHPCCGHGDCDMPLEKANHFFCRVHADDAKLCCAPKCGNQNETGFRTCALREHREQEEQYREKGKAFFVLRKRLRAAAVPDSTLSDEEEDEYDLDFLDADVPEDDGASELGDDLRPVQPEGSSRRRKIRLSRKRTHNEQLAVYPCGVIAARRTFYHAEAPSLVAKFIYDTYGGIYSACPKVCFFDSNCVLSQFVRGVPEYWEFFKHIALPVDVFHFKCKHKESDEWCAQNCNPALFPQLSRPDGSWVFNSSAAEQTNAWIVKFQPIVREMLPHHYNFFLDEMIKDRNRKTINGLRDSGKMPYTLPASTLYASLR